MYSFRKLIVWFFLAAVILAAILPVAPGLLWAFLIPLLLFSLRATVPTVQEPESIFVPQAAFVSLLPSRAPPLAWFTLAVIPVENHSHFYCAVSRHRCGGFVSIKRKLRMLLLYLPLLAGSLSGVPMRPEDMDQIMEALNQERIEYVIPDDSENGDDTIKEVKKVIEGQ
jgi:hypothetical protein